MTGKYCELKTAGSLGRDEAPFSFQRRGDRLNPTVRNSRHLPLAEKIEVAYSSQQETAWFISRNGKHVSLSFL